MARPCRERRWLLRHGLGLGVLLACPRPLRGPVFAFHPDPDRASAPLVVFLSPSPSAPAAADARAGFALGIEEASRAASLLGRSLDALELDPGADRVETLRALADDRAVIALVVGGRDAHADAAASLTGTRGGLAFFGHGTPIPGGVSWLPPDASIVRRLADWAASERLRTWHLVTGDAPRERRLASLVEEAAADRGIRLAARTAAGERPSVAPGADLAILALDAPEMHRLPGPPPGAGDVPLALCSPGSSIEVQDGRRVIAPEVWHPELRAFGAAQLNARFSARFGRPMTSTAWGHWLAVKAAWEVVARFPQAGYPGADLTLRDALARLTLDGQKGEPLRFGRSTFLEQPIYLVERRSSDGQGRLLVAPRAAVSRPGGSAGAPAGPSRLVRAFPVGRHARLRQQRT